jgi:Secretion system C-terminal sorting domain
MEKIVLASILVLAYAGSRAQSFTLVNPQTHYYNSNVAQVSQGFATIHNGAGSALDVMVERTVNILAPGHTGYFCWDVCYGTSVNMSTGFLTVQPNADNSSFYCDIDPHGAAGLDTVCYRFFDSNNASDNVDICMYFDIGTGITTVDASQMSPLSVASPNPANTLSGINYYTDVTKNPKLVIYDLLGSKVFETNLVQKQGAFILNVSDFKQGIYVYSLIENGKSIATRKLVVTHK